MTKFSDQLFDDLMREHGPALALAGRPAAARRRVTAGRTALAGGSVAVAAAIAGTLVAGSGSPAYAVTKNADGTLSLAVYQASGIAGANARLRQLGDKQVVVVPAEPGCPAPAGLSGPKAGKITTQARVAGDGSITVNARGIPAGDILVIGVETSGHASLSAATLTSGPAPGCVSLPAPPPGSGPGSGAGAGTPGRPALNQVQPGTGRSTSATG